MAAKEAVEAEEAADDQALQESGLEGRPILVERGVEVQEGGRVLLAALGNRDPGHLDKVRTRMGHAWVTAGDEEEGNLGMEDPGEGKEWEGWDEVILAWAGVGSVRPPCGWYGRTGTQYGVGGGGVGGAADWRS